MSTHIVICADLHIFKVFMQAIKFLHTTVPLLPHPHDEPTMYDIVVRQHNITSRRHKQIVERIPSEIGFIMY